MTNPNSFVSRVRQWLSDVLEPVPDIGEGWCMDCSLNGGRTLIISAESYKEHQEAHKCARSPLNGAVTIRARWRAYLDE